MSGRSRFGPADFAAALAVVVIWGSNFVAMKIGLRSFTPFQLGAARYLFALLPLALFVRPPALRWPWVVAAGLGHIGQFGMLFVALRLGMTAALASVLMQTQVFFTALFAALLLRERLSGEALVGLLIAAGGLVCFSMDFVGDATATTVTVLSLLLNLGAASSWAAANVVTRKAQQVQPGYDALQFIVWMSAVPIVPFVAMAWCLEPAESHWRWLDASAGSWVAAAYLGWAATAVAYGLWTWLLKRHAASEVAPFSLCVPVIGLGAGVLALGESVSRWQLAGSACIVAALIVLMFGGRLVRARPGPAIERAG